MINCIRSSVSFCILFLFLYTNNINAQGFNSITTPDGTNIVAVGNSGKIYRSASGGVTYTSSTVSGAPNLSSVTSFGNDVWLTGQNGNVIKTLKTISPNSTYNVGSAANLNSITFLCIMVKDAPKYCRYNRPKFIRLIVPSGS